MKAQKTIKDIIELEGVGLHNGLKVNLCLKPTQVNSGIIFKRTDVESSKNIIEANYKNVSSPVICTRIKNSHGITVSTNEHLMDGSAFDFVTAIRSVGTQEQNDIKKYVKVLNKVEIKDGSKSISIEPLEKELIIDFEIIYKNSLIRTRRKEFKLSEGNLDSIYNSKTFCLYEDIDQIKSQGLAKGGSLENAIVVKDNKILNEDGLRYRDEFVNHKILDCLGDLMLTGYRVHGRIKTSQGGHQLTNTLLREFLSNKSNWELVDYQGQEKDHKGNSYNRLIAVNA